VLPTFPFYLNCNHSEIIIFSESYMIPLWPDIILCCPLKPLSNMLTSLGTFTIKYISDVAYPLDRYQKQLNKGNNKITELRTIFQRESHINCNQMSIQNNCKNLSSITLFMPFYQGFFFKNFFRYGLYLYMF